MAVSIPPKKYAVIGLAFLALLYMCALLRLGECPPQQGMTPTKLDAPACLTCSTPPVIDEKGVEVVHEPPAARKSNVTVVTSGWYSKEFETVKHLHETNKRVYAGYHGYNLVFLSPETFTKQPKLYGRDAIFGKLDGILANMKTCDYLMWMDVDVIITNMALSVENLASKYLGEDKHFAIQWPIDDAMPNAGVLLMKCSDEAAHLLQAAMGVKETYHNWPFEQGALNIVRARPQFKEMANVLSGDHDFNALCGFPAPREYCRWRRGDFLVHFAPLGSKDTVTAMDQYYWRTIDSWFHVGTTKRV